MSGFHLTPEQQAEAKQIEDVLMAAMRVEAKQIAELLASKSNPELFGQTEFQLRDRLLAVGARALDATLEARKKKDTREAAPAAPTARPTPGSSPTAGQP